jgi:hypothetical protein
MNNNLNNIHIDVESNITTIQNTNLIDHLNINHNIGIDINNMNHAIRNAFNNMINTAIHQIK